MKILSAEQIRQADAYTIENEPISSLDLMERAAMNCFQRIRKEYSTNRVFHIVCGIGNNGGDGLVIARYLHNSGFEVKVHLIRFSKKSSPDLETNLQRLEGLEMEVYQVKAKKDVPVFPENVVIIDALFGTGLSRPIEGLPGNVVEAVNESDAEVISIDAPSGLFSEDNTENDPKRIIKARRTFTFQVPKLAFLFADNAPFVGHWEVVPIGLDADLLASLEARNRLLEPFYFMGWLRLRPKFSHKGNFGHALMVGGSYGKMGAVVMASRACLRSGVGLLTAHIPQCGYEVLQTSVPEAMCIVDEEKEKVSKIEHISKYNVVGIGPGIGMEKETQNALKLLIQNTQTPLVIDADGLNMLSENPTWFHFLPAGSILTPHPGEFERLAGESKSDYQRYEKQKEFSSRYSVYVVLKGAHTTISTPDGKVFFNNTGNPGMATGGSGDVLTGMITGLLAQGYSSEQAALLGVWLHGLSGDLAMEQRGMESMIAGDLIENIGGAWHELRSTLIERSRELEGVSNE